MFRLPDHRRKYVTVSDMPARSSRATPAVSCQLYGRIPNPFSSASSYSRDAIGSPRFRFEIWPHSPFANRLVRSQSGTKLPLSVHTRVADCAMRVVGFNAWATDVISALTYRSMNALMAV